MRLLVPVLLVIVAAVAVVLLTRDGEEPYKVRAIFDNAGFVIPGEDVKVAGVKVGKIDELDITDDFKAAWCCSIDDQAYQDFRRDAECTIRPQSLIGERFVECEPTQARAGERAARSRSWRRSRTGRARASTCCRWRTPPSPSTSTCSTTSPASPSGPGCRSSSASWAPAWPAAAATSTRSSGAPTRRSRRSTRSSRSSPPRTTRCRSWRWTATRCSRRWRASAATCPRRSTTPPRWPRRPPSAATSSRPTSRGPARRSCASCARRWCASARSPTRRRRCSPTCTRRRRPSTA